jgi:hypothetical protein
MKYYSPATKGFYDPTVNDNIPTDAVEITDEYWASLLGEAIEFDGEKPVVKKPTPEELEFQRKRQYIYDRLNEYPMVTEFADAYYWTQNGKPERMEEYLAKCAEVKLKYPKPTP